MRSDSPNHRLIRKFKYLNMNDVAEDGLLEALSEVVDRVAKSLDKTMLAFMGEA